MTPAEYICWILLFVILVLLYYHQKMILQHLKEATDYMVYCAIESIFRVERLLQDKRGIILYTFKEDGKEYEIIKRKVEEKDNV